MPDTPNTNWNASKGSVTQRINDVDDYVFIAKKRDGSTFVMSSGDQRLAQDLLHSSPLGQKEGAGFGG